jgi:hypothetical protein
VEAAFRKIVVNARRALVVAAVHSLKRARRDKPMMKILAANAERIVDVLIRTGSETIKRNAKTVNA